ncbi:MAG TPA: hypothetical protein VN577_10720 [Terriglobales bacterium]|nr:hypothetical protein [Terriglobales bacterium]
MLLLLPIAGLASAPFISYHLRAASLLLRIENPNSADPLARYHTYQIGEATSELPALFGKVRARTYTPLGMADPPAMVVVHGVHHLGIDEPRLVAFSRALCASGIKVFTPEIAQLADYRITRSSIDLIGAISVWYSQQIGKKVGLLGLSFAGGESLIVAADPNYSKNLAFVVSIGGHYDMQRVSEFYVTGQIPRPDGSIYKMAPHEYGALVLVYSRPEEFFPAKDVPKITNALKLLLWEQVDESKAAAQGMTPYSSAKLQKLYEHDRSMIAGELKSAILKHTKEMEEVSPKGKLKGVKIPVLLLHGVADDVIPATEMEWIEKEVPRQHLRGALTSSLLSHVSIAGEPPWKDKMALVNFMSELMKLVDESNQEKLSN